MHILKNNFENSTDHYQGFVHAPVELVQYGDFLCGYCADVYPAIKLLLEKMGDDIKFVFRHYPMHTVHPLALEAAMAAEAAAMQGKFWYMHDMIFENQKHLLRSSFSGFAETIDLDIKTFEDSRGHKKLFHKVINDFENGVKCGVDSTPTFFINRQKYNGFDDFDGLYRTCRYAMNCKSMAG
jgi:protein-disulfide isomerase